MCFSLILGVLAASGGIIAAPFLLLRLCGLPKFPKGRVDAFLEKAWRGPLVHRGGTPENTLRAFRRSHGEGARGIEVDLNFTKDDHPVLLHDSTVDRTSNGTGRVHHLTLEQLKKLDFGVKFGSQYEGERIPTLSETLDVCEELDLLLFLELKGGGIQNIERVIKQMFQERPRLIDRVCIISFWPWMLYKVRQINPDIMCGMTIRSRVLQYRNNGERAHRGLIKHLLAGLVDKTLFWSVHNWLLKALGISLLLPHKNDILDKKIDPEFWSSRDVGLVAWTVNSRVEKNQFDQVLKIPYLTDSISVEAPEQS